MYHQEASEDRAEASDEPFSSIVFTEEEIIFLREAGIYQESSEDRSEAFDQRFCSSDFSGAERNVSQEPVVYQEAYESRAEASDQRFSLPDFNEAERNISREQGIYQEAYHDDSVEDFSNEEYFKFVDEFIELYPTDSTGYVTKIQSLLQVGRYKEAFLFFEQSSALYPEIKDLLMTTYLRTGAQYFDISEDIAGWARTKGPPNDPFLFRSDGDLIGPVEIGMTSNGCGRGLFATEDVSRGDVILISAALAVTEEPAMNTNPLLQIAKDALNSCGEKARQIFFSHCLKDRSQFIPKMSDFVFESNGGGNQRDWAMLSLFLDELPEKTKEQQIHNILQLIAFDNSSPSAMKEKSKEPDIFEHFPARMYYGVWLLPSFINHSCVPNAARINVGDLMRIHATRAIKSGEEITIPYFNVLVPFPSRQKYCCSNFGFRCVCKRCKVEANKMEKSSVEVMDLYWDYEKIIQSSEVDTRASQLQTLLIRVVNCVKYLRDTEIFSEEDEMAQKWYMASFAPVYLASLLNRHRNEAHVEFCLVNMTNFPLMANALIETCPGSLHCLVFFHETRGKFMEFLDLHGNGISRVTKQWYEKYIAIAGSCMELEIAPAVYGSSHLHKVIHYVLRHPT